MEGKKPIKSILLFRHGARAPTKTALQTLGVNKEILQSWTLPNGELFTNELTPEGKNQCEILGEWAREYCEEKHPSLSSSGHIKWRSSAVQRVKDSGKLFWQGFNNGKDTTITVTEEEYTNDNDNQQEGAETSTPAADYTMRPWDANKTYKKWVPSIMATPEFQEKIKKRITDIKSIVDTLELDPKGKQPLPYLLFGMTVAKEIVECERYSSEEHPKPVNHLLNKEQIRIIDDLSMWVWEKRFFNHPFVKENSNRLITELKEEISGAGKGDSPLFTVFSGHDYTLLVLLAGMGLTKYPAFLNFSSYILMEVFDVEKEDGSGSQRVFTVRLNGTPFGDDEGNTFTTVQHNSCLIPNSDDGNDVWKIDTL